MWSMCQKDGQSKVLCSVDLINAAISACFAYIILLILIYLRCSRLHSQLLNNDYLFPTHKIRALWTSLLFIAHLLELGDSILSKTDPHDLLVPSFALLVWIGEFLLNNLIERARRPRYLIFSTLVWVFTLAGRILRLWVFYTDQTDPYKYLRLYSISFTITVIALIVLTNLYTVYIEICRNVYSIRDPVTEYVSYQYTYVNIFSKATFWWLTQLLWAGYREPLEINDLGVLPSQENAETQFKKFKKIYLNEQLITKPPKKVSLWRCYFKFCYRNFLLGGFLKLLGDCLTLIGPLAISFIITFITRPPQPDGLVTPTDFFTNGYILGIIVFLTSVLQGTLSQNSTHLINVEGIHLKLSLQSLIYTKSLKLPMQSEEIGQITNLLAEDAFNVMSFFWIGHYTWAIPLKIGVLIYLLNLKLGLSAVIGAFICIFTMSPLQFVIGKRMSSNSEKISDQSDERLRKINEIVQGIKLIKLMGWEMVHEKRIMETRVKELKYLNNDSVYWALMTFLTHASSILITLVTFGVYYVIENDPLTPENVFAGLALFNQLTVPLFIFPVTVPIIISAIVSTKRIEEFLSQEEIQNGRASPSSGHSKPVLKKAKLSFGLKHIEEDEEQQTGGEENVLEIHDGKFSWDETDKPTLVVPSLTIPKGKLTIIVGKIGSGKTSLISAMLNEMNCLSGRIKWSSDATVAYVSQKPWLMNASIRENILFGEPFKPKRYARIVKACALKADLDTLPANDSTEVGEQGINLSGGQKQRITIARALYSQANTIIMDDPLSALDYEVAKHVFLNGIRRQKRRTIILVTHRAQLVENAFKVVIMDQGTIRDQGTVQQLPKLDILSNDFKNRTKTAKDRWNLFRLVSKFGIKHRNTIHETSFENEDIPKYRPLQKRPSSIYGSRYFNIAHDLPLPTDECDEITDVTATTSRRRSNVISPKTQKAATRAVSLQSHSMVKGRPVVLRQLSSPSIQHEAFRVESFKKRLSTVSMKSQSGEDVKLQLHRLKSAVSVASDDENESIILLNESDQAIAAGNEEERSYGRIPKRIFWVYIKAGGVCVSASYLISALTWQCSRVYTDYWLSKWTELDKINVTDIKMDHPRFYYEHQTEYYLIIYGVLSLLSVVLSLASNGLGQLCGAIAREHLHNQMLKNVLQCPMYFFETTPIGRIINRFSTDQAILDKKIAISIQRLLQFLFLCLSAILVNAIVTPWFLIIAIPVCLIYYIVQKFYRCSSRELQRLDSITRSPVLSHFSETLQGLPTIRAYSHQSRFLHTMYRRMDTHTNAFLILNTSNRWLGIVLDYLGAFIVLTAIIACLLTSRIYPKFVTPALVGLAVNYTLLVPVYLTWVVKFVADMEMYMSAVERLDGDMPSEDYQRVGVKLLRNWPQNGEILFDNVSLKYKNHKEEVISNLNLHIPAGQKIGVCGRTGSGKSSLILSLFGMVNITSGTIKIDNIDINSVQLQKLRSKISIIPQDIIMFGGTVRDNLDPLKRYTDSQIWASLEIAQMKQVVAEYLGGLDGEIREGGSNLSSGERQLLCLARVILQDSSITIMDEATSSVDAGTEKAFLGAIQNAFKDTTVITIAHRLEMILGCDRIIVLENGSIVEDGTPLELQNKPDGIFAKMIQSSN